MANGIPLIGPQVPATNALDLALIAYSYRTAANPVALGAIGSGQFTSVTTIAPPGTGIQIDIVKDQSTGQFYVIPRGTANIQNGLTDLTLPTALATQSAVD